MKAVGVFLVAAILASAGSAPCRADPPLAGSFLVATAPGQPFCTDRRQLAAYVLATIQHDEFPSTAFPSCIIVRRGTPVQVTEDLGPRGGYMHMVRAHAALSFPFRAVDAYTYSVGLAPNNFDTSLPPFRFFP